MAPKPRPAACSARKSGSIVRRANHNTPPPKFQVRASEPRDSRPANHRGGRVRKGSLKTVLWQAQSSKTTANVCRKARAASTQTYRRTLRSKSPGRLSTSNQKGLEWSSKGAQKAPFWNIGGVEHSDNCIRSELVELRNCLTRCKSRFNKVREGTVHLPPSREARRKEWDKSWYRKVHFEFWWHCGLTSNTLGFLFFKAPTEPVFWLVLRNAFLERLEQCVRSFMFSDYRQEFTHVWAMRKFILSLSYVLVELSSLVCIDLAIEVGLILSSQ